MKIEFRVEQESQGIFFSRTGLRESTEEGRFHLVLIV